MIEHSVLYIIIRKSVKLLKIMLVFTGRGSTTVFNSMFYLESV